MIVKKKKKKSPTQPAVHPYPLQAHSLPFVPRLPTSKAAQGRARLPQNEVRLGGMEKTPSFFPVTPSVVVELKPTPWKSGHMSLERGVDGFEHGPDRSREEHVVPQHLRLRVPGAVNSVLRFLGNLHTF